MRDGGDDWVAHRFNAATEEISSKGAQDRRWVRGMSMPRLASSPNFVLMAELILTEALTLPHRARRTHNPNSRRWS